MDLEAKTGLIEQIIQTLSLPLASLSCCTQQDGCCTTAGQPALRQCLLPLHKPPSSQLQEEKQDPQLTELSVTLVKISV